MQQNSRCPFSGSGSFSLLAVRSMVACRQPFFHHVLPAVAFRCAPLVWVSGRWPACCAPSAERIFLPAAAAKLMEIRTSFYAFPRPCVPLPRCRHYVPLCSMSAVSAHDRAKQRPFGIASDKRAPRHIVSTGSLPDHCRGKRKEQRGRRTPAPLFFMFVLCRQPPRYAFLTSSLASRSSPVPDSTMLPFSST